MCILDELGRGTATFDGTAIAHSVVDSLLKDVHCRALFATHYHSLIDDWKSDPRIQLGHMECVVGSQMHRPSEAVETDEVVTFLYKLNTGSSPHSYGINVARLAKLPLSVIHVAKRISSEFEEKMKQKQNLKASKLRFNRLKCNGLFEKLTFLNENFRTPSTKNSILDVWNACQKAF